MRYLLAIFLLGLLVALHELGHLVAARLCRMKVERFAVGFGPPLLATRRRGTQYSLRAIPFGGFVRVAGMEAAGEGPPGPGSFRSRPRWQRALVLVSGSALNYLCALALLFALYAGGRRVPVPGTVGEVTPGSEAARVQLRPGDVVEAVDGRPVREWSDLTRAVAEHAGPQLLVLAVRRGDQALEVRAAPRPDEEGVPRLGVSQLYAYRQLTRREAAAYAVHHASSLVVEGLTATWGMLRGRPGATLEGPVTIAQRTAGAATSGADALVALLAAISVALAVFNLLPVPGLDGGRLVLLAIAAVRGKPADPRVEAVASAVGFFALIALAVWVTVRDVRGARAAVVEPAVDAGAPAADAGTADAGM
jgi:regulator of sigma E protease